MKIRLVRIGLSLLPLGLLSSCQGDSTSKQEETPTTAATPSNQDLPLVKLTSGPKQHWFGYYDKLQMDPTGTSTKYLRTKRLPWVNSMNPPASKGSGGVIFIPKPVRMENMSSVILPMKEMADKFI